MFEKKRGKRFLASVMALIMLLSLAPVGALAAGEEPPTNEESPAVTLPAVDPKSVVDTPENGETTNSDTENGVAALPLLDESRPVADNSDATIIPEKELIDGAFGVDSKEEIQQYGSKENGNAVVQYSVSGSNTVKVGETITLTCDNNSHWHNHNWYTFGNSVAVEGDTASSTITVKGLKEGTATVYCGTDSKKINVTDPQYVIRFYVSGTRTDGLYTEQNKYSVAGQPNSTFEDAIGKNPLELSVSAGYAILTGYNDTAKNISTNDFKDVSVTGDEAVRAWLTEYANHGVPEGLTNRENVESIVAQVNEQYNTANTEFYNRNLLPSLQTNYFNGFRFVDAYYVKSGESTIHVNVQLVKNTEYTVHYDSNDGTENVSYDSDLYQTGDSVTVKNNMFARTGYEFVGWNTKADGTGTDYASGNTFNIESANVTLYAKWTPKTYTVTFKTENGGKINGSASDVTHSVAYDSDFPETPGVTADTHYEFDKWVDENGNKVTTFPKKVTGNATYIAKWKQVSTDPTPVTPVAARYIVEHYKWNAVTKTYALAETEYGPATAIGTTVTATPKQYDDYTLNLAAEGAVQEGTIPKFTKDAPQILTLKLYYDIDKIGDGENKNQPDGIPDRYQVTINYISNDNTMGTVSVGKEVKTIESAGKWQESGTVKISGSTAQPKENYHYVKWTDTDGTDLKSEATLPTKDISMTGGQVYTFTAYFAENSQPDSKKLNYTIIQNFIDGKGNPIEAMKKRTPKTIAAEDAAKVKDLNTMIPEDMQKGFTDSASNKYMYVPTKTTFSTETLRNGTEINLYYYLDNWKDGSSVEEDNDKGGDGIPDCDQVLIKYVSSNSDRGTVSPDMEVLTIRETNEKVVPTANGSTATDKGGRNYFSNWTKDNTQVSTNATLNNETIQKEIKEFTGGKTYTFTANFGYSSGGGGGGSRPTVTIPDDVPTGLNGTDHYAYIIGYGNNDVRPQNNITRAEVATIFFRLLTDETRTANMTKSNSYNDVKDGDWFCCAVSTLSKMGIIKGYEDGSFKPNDPISRAEFAAIAARFDPDGDKTPATFADVTSHWAKDEISIAANHGWIKGYEDGSFKPDQKITRAETMTLVNRVLNRLPETKDDLHKDMKTWVDNMDETAWYYLAVQEATNSHYFKNKTSTKFEQWTDLRDTRDWSELEK